MTWSIYYLAINPDVQEKAHKEVQSVVGGSAEIGPTAVDELV